MNEDRKFALLFAASLFAARKLNEVGTRPSPARDFAISDAISKAELILRKLDEKYPPERANGAAAAGKRPGYS